MSIPAAAFSFRERFLYETGTAAQQHQEACGADQKSTGRFRHREEEVFSREACHSGSKGGSIAVFGLPVDAAIDSAHACLGSRFAEAAKGAAAAAAAVASMPIPAVVGSK